MSVVLNFKVCGQAYNTYTQPLWIMYSLPLPHKAYTCTHTNQKYIIHNARSVWLSHIPLYAPNTHIHNTAYIVIKSMTLLTHTYILP